MGGEVSPAGERQGAGEGAAEPARPDGLVATARGARSSVPTKDAADGGQEAVTQIEVLSDLSLKRMYRVIHLIVLVGTGLLFSLFGMKMTRRYDGLGEIRPVVVLNAVVAALDLVVVTGSLAWFLRRLAAVRRAGMTLSRRRKRLFFLFSLQAACVCISNLLFLTPNVYILSTDCGYDHLTVHVCGGARWTALNSVLALFVIQARAYNLIVDKLGHPVGDGEDTIYLDAPWRAHWFIGMYWAIFEGMTAWAVRSFASAREVGVLCTEIVTCPTHVDTHIKASLFVLMTLGYFSMFLYFMRNAFVIFAKKSYVHYRWSNITARFTFRQLGVIMLFSTLSFAFLWFVRTDSCMSIANSWLGFAPMQMTLALFMAVRAYITMPILPDCKKRMSALAADAHWLEKDSLQHGKDRGPDLGGEHKPLFCFETAIKLVYWCEFIYEYNSVTKVAKPPFSMETALSLYDLTHFEHLHARGKDAHAIVAWGQAGTILVCFRGTYSAANVRADLQFWQMPHPPLRGHMWLGTRPMVHKGFLQSWLSESFDETVLGKVRQALGSPGFDRQNLKIYVTGHSLGGAMAVLAAHDISRRCGILSHQLSCYTFGSPRVGNYSFAADHDQAVPDTWHVINDLDTVPRMGKFWMLFKRSGQRVIINARGDMIVSPMFLEFKLSSAIIGKTKVVHHLLSAYRRSLSAVALAQFHMYKALPGGTDAMKELLAKGDITRVLGVSHGSAKKLLAMASKIWTHRAERLGAMAKEGQPCLSVASGSEIESSSGRSWTLSASLKTVASGLLPCMSRQGEGLSRGSSIAGVDVDIEAVEFETLEEQTE